MTTRRNLSRIGRTRHDLTGLRKRVDAWLELRRDLDERSQYSTQLDNLETFFDRLFAALWTQVDGIQTSAEGGAAAHDVYQDCRTVDLKLVWLRGVWEYYAEKFDQRDDTERFGKVIRAADEVVWSCYAGFNWKKCGSERKAAPLPYIEPLYSPLAIPRDKPPPSLRSRFVSGEFFQKYLKEMPIPVIGLPRSCLEAPWWLIYIGHEVGHHIQHDLLPKSMMVGKFGNGLADAAKASGAAGLAAVWNDWGQEVFADAFSIYGLGVWAVWSMTELILGGEQYMLTQLETYPAPAVRLALMAQLATELGQDGQVGLRGFVPKTMATGAPLKDEDGVDLRKEAKKHLALVPAMVKAIDKYDFEGKGSFRKLSGWQASDFASKGAVEGWTDSLREGEPLGLKKNVTYPRLVASAGLAAWAEIDALADDTEREDAVAELVPRFLDEVVDCGPEDKRAADKPPSAEGLKKTGDSFAQQFLELSPEDLDL